MTLAPETTTALKVQLRLEEDWFEVCDLTLLTPGRGIAALLPDGRQAALFRDRSGALHGIDNRDPFSGAAVLSRGLTGTDRGRPFVASPLLKQRFDLLSGQCLDDATVRVAVYEVRAR
ncbi:nitrite reductase small subunit NirD [Streptomyces sp. NPDC005423]|uniref:nitrite reductase small subunit NirD n=1 Tax=Streptomyces sp. NPDC005423 TaxID=3155343 RepID=UPI0033ACDE3A